MRFSVLSSSYNDSPRPVEAWNYPIPLSRSLQTQVWAPAGKLHNCIIEPHTFPQSWQCQHFLCLEMPQILPSSVRAPIPILHSNLCGQLQLRWPLPLLKNVQSVLRILQFSADHLSCSPGCLLTERTCSQDPERGNPETAKQAGQEGSTYQHLLLPAFPFIRAFKCREEEVGVRENRGPVFGYT